METEHYARFHFFLFHLAPGSSEYASEINARSVRSDHLRSASTDVWDKIVVFVCSFKS